jgi:hypothetical protein
MHDASEVTDECHQGFQCRQEGKIVQAPPNLLVRQTSRLSANKQERHVIGTNIIVQLCGKSETPR